MLVSLSMTIGFMKEIQYPPTPPKKKTPPAFVIGPRGWMDKGISNSVQTDYRGITLFSLHCCSDI